MNRRLLVVVGPQASGKSSLLARLQEDYPDALVFQEARQVIVRKNQRLGAKDMTEEDEIEVIHYDMVRLRRIRKSSDKSIFWIDETNLFTTAHAAAHGVGHLEGYHTLYQDLLAEIGTGVLFLDVPPALSWERRVRRYEERMAGRPPQEAADYLTFYRAYAARLHAELTALYERIMLPKRKIDATSSQGQVYLNALAALEELGFMPHASDRGNAYDGHEIMRGVPTPQAIATSPSRSPTRTRN